MPDDADVHAAASALLDELRLQVDAILSLYLRGLAAVEALEAVQARIDRAADRTLTLVDGARPRPSPDMARAG